MRTRSFPTRTRLLIGVLGIFVVATAGLVGSGALKSLALPWHQGAAQIALKTFTVQLGSVSKHTYATGTVGLASSVTISAPFQATLASLDISVGQAVTTGQAIGRLDTSTLAQTEIQDRLNVEAAQEKLQQIETGTTSASSQATAAQSASQPQNSLQQAQAGARQAQIADSKAQATLSLDRAALIALQQQQGSTAQQLTTARSQVEQDQTALSQADNAVVQAQAALAQAEAALTAAQSSTGTSSGPDPLQIALAGNQVEQAQAALQAVLSQEAEAVMTSPIAGTVLSLGAASGQQVSPTTAIATVADLSRMAVQAPVNEVDMPSLKVGDPVTVTVSAFSGQSFSGSLTSIGFTPTTSQNVVTYPVSVAIADSKGILRAGMTASISILTAQAANVLYLPSEAISGGHVLLRQGSQLVPATVQTGLVGDTQTQILSTFLKVGEVVVVKGQTSTAGSPTTKGSGAVPGIPGGAPGGGPGGPGGPPPAK